MPEINEPDNNSRYLYWIALKNVPGIGKLAFKRLMDRFGDPYIVSQAQKHELLSVEGITPKMVAFIHSSIKEGGFPSDVTREYDLARRRGYRMITQADAGYPALLLEIHDPPPYLYAHGQVFEFSPAVAVVGSRHPTSYGISMARRLGADLAAKGFIVVSGMAAGIDSAAHQGAISREGKTVAVLGSGLAVIYPPENRKLYYAIADSGVVLSELPILEPPNAYNFPARNRIISGMTLGTVVVEAAKKSGSLITAKLAAEQGRDVFAVPGSIKSYKSTGAHSLLKQGAKLVETVDDIVEEFYNLAGMNRTSEFCKNESVPGAVESIVDLTPEESLIYYHLDPYPVHIDELAQRAGKDAAGISAILLKLELKGMATQVPGKYFMSSGEK